MHSVKRFCQIAGAPATNTVVQFITAIATCYLIGFAHQQFEQANLHKRWQNYNDINNRYAELYKEHSDLPTHKGWRYEAHQIGVDQLGKALFRSNVRRILAQSTAPTSRTDVRLSDRAWNRAELF